MNRTKDKRKRLSRQLLLRYCLRLVVTPLIYVGVVFLTVLLGIYLAGLRYWYTSDFWYPLYSLIRDNITMLIIAALAVGIVGILFFQLWRIVRDMTALATVIEQMNREPEKPIELPSGLAEIELQLRQVQLETLHNQEIAREAEQRKNDLVVYLAHDLKTPLTSVLGYLTLLRDEPDISPELRQKYLSIATGKAGRLEDLINEFFEITRYNLKGLVLETTRLHLSRMLEQVNDEFRPLYAEKDLVCIADIQPDLELVADAGKLERVVDNLLRNAVNYSWPGSQIHLSARDEDGLLRLEVENQGDTIPEHKLARIFEQFYRLDASRGTEGGSGLGLAIAREIVELHGGSIAAQSADNMIRFTVFLPLKKAEAIQQGQHPQLP